MEIYFHFGMPRTASKFFEQRVYGKFQDKDIIVNPPEFSEFIKFAIYKKVNNETLRKAKEDIDNILGKMKAKKILIHNWIAMDPWLQSYGDYHTIIKYCFPDAKVIMMMRYQVDWIVSLYNLSSQKQCYQDIKGFLNYSNNKFNPVTREPLKPNESASSVRKNRLDINTVRIPDLFKQYYNTLGEHNYKIIFFEDFLKNKSAVVGDICKYIGVSTPHIVDFSSIGKSPSAFTTKLMHLIYYGFGIYTPSFSASQERKNRNFFARAYMSFAVRLNQLIFSSNYDISEKRNLDKLFYYNWDILKKDGLRDKLDKIFKEDNKKLLEFIPREKIPDVYL